MNKAVAGALVTVVSLGLIGAIVVFSGNNDSMSSDSMQDMMSSGSMNSTTTESTAQSNNTLDPEAVQTGTVAMDIVNFDFQYPKITVKEGTTVTWTNRDEAGHDVRPDDEGPNFMGSPGLLQDGESYSYTFKTAGSYSYFCSPHPYMKAVVEVVK